MSVRIGTWNLHDGFSEECHIATIVEVVDSMDVDAMVFPEAYKDSETDHVPEVEERLRALGYRALRVPYADDGDRIDRHGLMVVDRTGGTAEVARLATRNALLMHVRDGRTDVALSTLGMHLDDRSEANRLAQVRAAIALDPDVMAGDMNSAARYSEFFRPLTWLPARYATAETAISMWERMSNVAHRVGSIATSSINLELGVAGYSDNAERATWPSILPMLRLDRIMAKSPANLAAVDVYGRVPFTDHLAIVATVET